jgi:phage shock protein A
MQRAQDKISSMQARAGALDELLASGALEDLSHPVDDIQKELDKVSSTNQVDNELAAMRAELGAGGGGGGGGAGVGDAAALPTAAAESTGGEHGVPGATQGVPAVEQGGTGGESA